ncbi:hypothetical protein RND71_004707 [Anisodus tanguticus]|uniref:Pectinesterase catalytic domain-containing protein n=1 Tax=Anisodus tanguticus TaxID=243964 RepID=A0AAE1SQL4_9SOLA|nr:hypothetical protein RND71_004707 [Anisodus tanguticus]
MNLMGILVIIFLTSFSFVAHISYGDLIDDVCQKSDDNNLCVKSLIANPRSASANKKGLTRIMVQNEYSWPYILHILKTLFFQIWHIKVAEERMNEAGPVKQQAVALRAEADYISFYRCRFEGYQDTLYTRSGNQFFRDCQVFGTIDFICGDATSVFQNCTIEVRAPLPGQYNTITTQK